MELEKEVMDTIRAKLPEIHAQALQAYFRDAEITANRLKGVETELRATRSQVEELNQLLTEYKKLESRWKDLDSREAAIHKKEVEFEILRQRVELEKEKTATVKEMFATVFRNIEVRKTVLSPAIPAVVQGGTGSGMGYVDRTGNLNNPAYTDKTESTEVQS